MAHHGNRSYRLKFCAVCCHNQLSNASIRMLLPKLPFRSLSPAFHLRTKGVPCTVSLKPVDVDFRLGATQPRLWIMKLWSAGALACGSSSTWALFRCEPKLVWHSRLGCAPILLLLRASGSPWLGWMSGLLVAPIF